MTGSRSMWRRSGRSPDSIAPWTPLETRRPAPSRGPWEELERLLLLEPDLHVVVVLVDLNQCDRQVRPQARHQILEAPVAGLRLEEVVHHVERQLHLDDRLVSLVFLDAEAEEVTILPHPDVLLLGLQGEELVGLHL